MSEIEVSKCRYYIKQDGSCSSQDTDCVKCINCYCDWKVYQEQLQQLKEENEELKKQLKAYTKPDVVKALTFYRTGEFDLVQKQKEKYELKFEKIKEFCEQNKYGGDTYDWTDVLANDILQIIESEDDDNSI